MATIAGYAGSSAPKRKSPSDNSTVAAKETSLAAFPAENNDPDRGPGTLRPALFLTIIPPIAIRQVEEERPLGISIGPDGAAERASREMRFAQAVAIYRREPRRPARGMPRSRMASAQLWPQGRRNACKPGHILGAGCGAGIAEGLRT